ITDDCGVKQWKSVTVKLEDHAIVPIFQNGLSPESYDGILQDYLSNTALEKLPQSRPLWEIHIFKYPTSNAAGTLIFKLHHALRDGFSLMGALFRCFQRADDPFLPITFPSSQLDSTLGSDNKGLKKIVYMKTTARYIRSTLNNTSMTISNMIGPMERIVLAEHPCTGIYFMVVGIPQVEYFTLRLYIVM
ncbi:hypothetical protein GIB67_014522, partial [Kingdonia uniflora]